MLARIARSYWYPGLTGHKFFKNNYVKKLATYEELNPMDDPIDSRNFTGPYSTIDGMKDPVQTIVDRLKYRQNLDMSPSTTGYVAYNGAKSENKDPFLWREVEFYITKNLPEMEPRVLFGCLYGLLRSGKGTKIVLESLIKEFDQKAMSSINGFDCFELVEAISFGKRENYDTVNYMHEVIMPKLEKLWKSCRFLHIESYLLRMILNLSSLNYYEQWIWERILAIVHKKKFGNLEKWELFYRTFNVLKNEGVEKDAGIELSSAIQHFESLWAKRVDFQWKYKLDEKRFYTVEEMINRDKESPVEMTWQEGEKYIKHNLPKWYWEMDLGLDKDVSGLYEEMLAAKKEE
jgi:hypothetical protein